MAALDIIPTFKEHFWGLYRVAVGSWYSVLHLKSSQDIQLLLKSNSCVSSSFPAQFQFTLCCPPYFSLCMDMLDRTTTKQLVRAHIFSCIIICPSGFLRSLILHVQNESMKFLLLTGSTMGSCKEKLHQQCLHTDETRVHLHSQIRLLTQHQQCHSSRNNIGSLPTLPLSSNPTRTCYDETELKALAQVHVANAHW